MAIVTLEQVYGVEERGRLELDQSGLVRGTEYSTAGTCLGLT